MKGIEQDNLINRSSGSEVSLLGGGVGLVVALSSLCPCSHLHDRPADEDKSADESDDE